MKEIEIYLKKIIIQSLDDPVSDFEFEFKRPMSILFVSVFFSYKNQKYRANFSKKLIMDNYIRFDNLYLKNEDGIFVPKPEKTFPIQSNISKELETNPLVSTE